MSLLMTSKKRYKIVITEMAEEETLTRREWKPGCGGHNRPDDGENNGYTPQVKQIEIVEREILMQYVKELDVVKYIRAINNI